MNVIEVLETLPDLYQEDPKAALVYITAKEFCDRNGHLTIRLKMIGDHLQLAPAELKAKCTLLQQKGLIAKDAEGVVLPTQKAFSSKKNVSDLVQFSREGIPEGYEVLLDEKQMYECYTTIGNQLWKVLAQVAAFLKVDFKVLTRLMHNQDFRKQFTAVRKTVEQAAEISGQRVTRRKNKRAPSKSTSELVQQLYDEVHLRNGVEIPRSEWKSPQLLRVFVLMYRKRYNEDYVFTGNPFSSLEMREIRKIAKAFDDKAEDVIEFLKWCFTTKSYEPRVINPLRIRFCSSDNVIREFIRIQQQGGTATTKEISNTANGRAAPLPTEFIEWIVTNHKSVHEVYRFSKREDLAWLKEAYNSDELPDEALKPIVEEAIKRGLV